LPSSGNTSSRMLKPSPSLCGDTRPILSQKSSRPERRGSASLGNELG
jgi:hypothetical protein